MENQIKSCRACNSPKLWDFLDLGTQALTGVFPASELESETFGKLVLTKCEDCHLVQLKHKFPMAEMYGDNYGYRSGLNNTMVKHLRQSVERVLSLIELSPTDLIIDVGSNDGTLLGFYPDELNLNLIGVDPVGKKFAEFYKSQITLIPDFFPSQQLDDIVGTQKAKVITSFSCFYDLENPTAFIKDIRNRLHEKGIWVFEQSYLPLMVSRLSYDTVCHEHLEYYCLTQVKRMLEENGLKILDVTFNDVNGGSFCVTASKMESAYLPKTEILNKIIADEKSLGLHSREYYQDFARKVTAHGQSLRKFIKSLKDQGKVVAGLGASTKGNVVLQYCGLDKNILQCVGEVNPYKFSRITPGTHIPIVSETDLEKLKPDFKLVLPWHFRETFINREKTFIEGGGKLIFAMPDIEVYPL